MDHETITAVHNPGDPDDTCAITLDCERAARDCLSLADVLPDGAPEQVSVLLRGLLAAQLGTMQMLMEITGKLDAWTETHGEWHARTGQRCPEGDRCEYA